MTSEAVRETAPEHGSRTPLGTVNVVDPHPLNWLYVTWNTMEEPVRTDEKGNIVGAAMEAVLWESGAPVQRHANVASQRRTVPPKRSSPLPITPGGDVLLESARAQPSPGRQRRQRPRFPS